LKTAKIKEEKKEPVVIDLTAKKTSKFKAVRVKKLQTKEQIAKYQSLFGPNTRMPEVPQCSCNPKHCRTYCQKTPSHPVLEKSRTNGHLFTWRCTNCCQENREQQNKHDEHAYRTALNINIKLPVPPCPYAICGGTIIQESLLHQSSSHTPSFTETSTNPEIGKGINNATSVINQLEQKIQDIFTQDRKLLQ